MCRVVRLFLAVPFSASQGRSLRGPLKRDALSIPNGDLSGKII